MKTLTCSVQILVNALKAHMQNKEQFFNDRFEVLTALAQQYRLYGNAEDAAICHARAMLAAKYLERCKQ